jgi:ELWxxDGT repeat protein
MIRQTVLFGGLDASGGVGLWETNGTAAGTYELTGVPNGVFSPADFTVFNNEVLFQGQDTSLLYGIWETNGTAAGTTEIGGIGSTGIHGASSSGLLQSPNTFDPDFTVFNGEVLFEGVDASGDHGLWMTNGTAAGTTEIGGIANGDVFDAYSGGLLASNDPSFAVLNGEVLFNGVNASGHSGLWVTNGKTFGTSELIGIQGANSFLEPSDMTVLNGSEVLFGGMDSSGRLGLWVTNGAAAGTFELPIFVGPDPPGLEPVDLTVLNGQLLFNGNDTSGHRGLWVSNGTAAHELIGISGANTSVGLDPVHLTVFSPNFLGADEALFNGIDSLGHVGLWETNGTVAGTHELVGIDGANPIGINPSNFTTVRNGGLFSSPEVLFNGTDQSGNFGLWVTDGTSAGTSEITGIGGASPSGINPKNLATFTFVVPPPEDFLGNNTSDILFQNTTSGDTWFEAITNGALESWNQIGGSDTTYSVVGVGDFFGTGKSDILYRNKSTGDTWFESISNGAFGGWTQIGGSNTSYVVAGLGDFSGYGTSDILFRNTSTGDTWFEAMSNGKAAGWSQVGGSDTNYSIIGVGDFYGSGTDDILFRNNSTGDIWIEQMTNGAFAGWQQIGGSDTHYSVVGVGDFFGGGLDDILFRNNSTGDTWLDLIGGGIFTGWLQIGGSDTTYSVVGVGDYFGGNTSNILFRNNSTGDTWIEGSNGSFTGWQQVGGSSTAYTVPITVGPPAMT